MATARRQVRRAASTPIHSDVPEIEELSRRIIALEKGLPDFAAQGVEVEFSVTGAGSMTLTHGLGRAPLGWIVTDRTTAASVFRLSSGTDAKHLGLYCSAACSGRIWVY